MGTVIVAILGAIGGGAGLAAVLTVIFQHKKFRAEAEALRIQNERTEMEYVKQSLIELHEKLKTEISEVRESNKILEQRVDILNKKIVSLMKWIMGDDHRYRSWLENKIHEMDPSVEFPHLSDPPEVFGDDGLDIPKS